MPLSIAEIYRVEINIKVLFGVEHFNWLPYPPGFHDEQFQAGIFPVSRVAGRTLTPSSS